MSTAGQISLDNFYRSVQFDNPDLAVVISDDIVSVSMDGLVTEKSQEAKDAAERLRRVAFDLPVIQARVLDNALTRLGF